MRRACSLSKLFALAEAGSIQVSALLICITIFLPPAQGQTRGNSFGSAQPPPRIKLGIDESKLVRLEGNIRPEVNPRNDRGPVPDNLPIEHMQLLLRRSPQQEEALEGLIDQINNPRSPEFHQWLTTKEFGERYGLGRADLNTIKGWLASHGFVVNLVYPNGILIDFSGTAGEVREAFHTQIHWLMVNGKRHFANVRNPQIPAALAPAVIGIVSLNDFRPQPIRPSTPEDTYGGPCGLSGACYGLVPADIAKIYNLDQLFSAGVAGLGQTIAVVESSDVYDLGDWTTFRSTFGLSGYSQGSFETIHPSIAPEVPCYDPGIVPNYENEAILDAEWASAAAPNATIELASCKDGDTWATPGFLIALENLITSGSPPPLISVSYGESEDELGATANAAISEIYQQGVTEGVSIFVSSGDTAAANSDHQDPPSKYAAYGLNVNGFASTPYDVAVGGTDFADTYLHYNSLYWGTNDPSNFGSALSYIPEIPWNDSCASSLISSFEGYVSEYAESSFCNSTAGTNYLNVQGGGGGQSGCATGSPALIPGIVNGSLTSVNAPIVSGTCAGYSKPSWQSIVGNPHDGVRDVPDVSLFAGDGVWGHSYTFCFSDTANKGAPCTGDPGGWSHGGGTSFSAPIMAGIQALINEKTGARWGNPDPIYYSLAASEYGTSGNSCFSTVVNVNTNPCIFYDVTLGDTEIPCRGANCYLPSGTYGVLSAAPQALTKVFVSELGSGYSSAPSCSLSGGGGAGAACSAFLTTVVSSVTLSSGGGEYTSPPSCNISGGGGSGAVCAAAITNGSVSSVYLESFGSGYTSPPSCTISGGGGSGATCTAAIGNGVATTLTSPGSGYTTLPNCVLSGGGGSGAVCVPLAENSAASYQPSYAATTGWDFATGIGSVNAYNLAMAMPTAVGAPTLLSPSNGMVASSGTTSMSLTWSSVPGATSYNVQAFTGSCGGTFFAGITGNSSITNWTMYGLSDGETYYWQVQAVGASGPSPYSNCFSFSVASGSTLGAASISLNPSIVVGGNQSVGTVTMSGPAPSQGATVTLSQQPSGVVTMQSSVTIAPGATSNTFDISTQSTSVQKNVTITASYGNSQQSSTLTINPASTTSLTITLSAAQTTVNLGQMVTLTATFSGATNGAPTGSAYFYDYFNGASTLLGTVALSASSGGQYTATYSSSSFLAGQHMITVIYDGDNNYSAGDSSVTITVQPQSQGGLTIQNFTVVPSIVAGGNPAYGYVYLTGNAPTGGEVVYVTSTDNHFIKVPPTVTVYAGSSSRGFPISTFFTSGTVGATINASLNGTEMGANLTVLPAAVSAISFSSNPVTSGNSVTITVSLNAPAPSGAFVSLTSSDQSVLPLPTSLNFATGATSASMTVTTQPVQAQETITVTATYNNSSYHSSLTVVPAAALTINSFGFSPDTITGGSSTTGTVYLTGLAPGGGAEVALSSASPQVQVPSSVTVPAGDWYASFTAQSSAVSSVTNVTVTANYGGKQSATLTLVPPLPFVSSLTLSPTTVTSGSPVTGTITLTAAPIQSIVVDTVVNVPVSIANVTSSVVIQPGSTSATFTIATSPIKFIAPVAVTVSYNGTTQTASFTIVPPGTPLAPSSLTFNPVSVSGGTSSKGTVILTAPAPSGGAVVTLSSGSSVVEVPLSVTVPAGTNTAIFTASTSSVSDISTATITASLNGVSQSSLLTVEPSGTPTSANPVPLLVPPLSPLSQTPGGTGFTLTVKGNGFVPGEQLFWGQTALPTTVVSESEVQATVPSSSVQSNMSPLVTVANLGQAIAASNPLPEHLTYPRTTVSFNSSTLSVSGSPYSVAFGDFNGDGKLDMVVGKSGGSGLSIFLGNGDGTFGPERIVPLPPEVTPSTAVIGDLNGDGKLDIVYNKSTSSQGIIGVLLGNGDGTFTAMPDVDLPASPGVNPGLGSDMALGDLNGDGKLDLVMTGNNLTGAYVLLGNGDGTFGPAQAVGSVTNPFSVALADFNGDGKVDIAITDYTNQSVAILLGNGDGTFQPQQEYPANGYAEALAVADFNGDGHPDIAVAEGGPVGGSTGGIAILLGNGDGTFASPVNYVGGGQEDESVAVDDLNGDGKLDLVAVTSQPSVQALIYLGNGDGTFSSTPISIPLPSTSPIAVADLNNDGAPDLIAPNLNSSSGAISVFLQTISPILQLSSNSLSFTAVQGGGNPTAASLTISNCGDGTAAWTASSSQSWLVLNQSSGTAPSTVSVSANIAGLAPGTYNAAITITSANASNSPQTVSVTLLVNPVSVVVSALSFNPAALTGPGTATANVTLSDPASVGGIDVTLSSDNSAVQVPASVTIPSGLTSRTFTATVSAVTKQTNATIIATYNGVSTSATLTVNPPSPSAGLSVASMSFGSQIVGTTSSAQSVEVTNGGTASLNFSSVATAGDFAVQKAGTTCSLTSPLAVDASCTIAIAFIPKLAGSLTGTLTLKDDAPSGSQQVALSGIGEDYALGVTSGTASTETVTPGSSTNYSLDVSPEDGFNQAVTLACTGAPQGSTCTVSPGSVTLDGINAAQVKVTVTTTSGSLATPPAPDSPSVPPVAFWITVFGMAALAAYRFVRERTRARLALLGLVAVLLISVAVCASCGGGAGGMAPSPSPSSSNATPAGTYTLTVTGTSGNLTHSATLTLKVQ